MNTEEAAKKPLIEQFLSELPGKSIALVYSYSSTIDKQRTWYDRWRSSVIMYFGQGAEALGLEVRYIDVDTYLSNMASHDEFPNDFILNLHSGLNDISSWPIISSFASWRNIPAGFCPSDVHVTCERKDITYSLALRLNLNLPKKWCDRDQTTGTYIIKERDLGKSIGLRKTDVHEELKEASSKDYLVVEEFVPGYDATVAVLANFSGGYTVIGARYCLPKGPDKHDWMFTEQRKVLPYYNEDFSTEKILVSAEIEDELIKLSQMLGDGSVYRYDFRVTPDSDGKAPPVMNSDNAWFLEVTPTPAISEGNDFGSIMKDVSKDEIIINQLLGSSAINRRGVHAPQSILVACILFKSTLNNCRHYR